MGVVHASGVCFWASGLAGERRFPSPPLPSLKEREVVQPGLYLRQNGVGCTAMCNLIYRRHAIKQRAEPEPNVVGAVFGADALVEECSDEGER